MKSLVLIAFGCLILSSCGDGNEQESLYGSNKAKEAQPLADNPPLTADALDAIVEEEKQRQNQPNPSNPIVQQQENTNGN